MAPEQMQGVDLDARVDVYGFSVALYEALFGQLPFTGKTSAEHLSAHTRGLPDSAPANAAAPAWLWRAVQRGLRHDREERYPSMAAMLEVLESGARPRLNRRRTLLIGATFALGLVATTAAMVRHAAQERRASCSAGSSKLVGAWDDDVRRRLDAAFEASPVAHSRFALDATRSALDAFAASWQGTYREACEATRIRGEYPEEVLTQRMGCLEGRARDLRILTSLLAGAPPELLKNAHSTVAALSGPGDCLRVDSGRSDDASQEVKDALLTARILSLAATSESVKSIQDTITLVRERGDRLREPEALYYLAEAHGNLGQFEPARQLHREAADKALSAGNELVLARAADQIAYLLPSSDEAVAREWLRIGKAVLPRISGQPDIEISLLRTEATWDARREHWGAAIEKLWKALRLADATGAHRDLDRTLRSLCYGLFKVGRIEEAIKVGERHRSLIEMRFGPDHPLAGFALELLALAHQAGGQYASAHELARRAIALRERTDARVFRANALLIAGLGRRLDGRPELARPYLLRAAEDLEGVVGETRAPRAWVHAELAMTLCELGDARGCRREVERAVFAARKSPAAEISARVHLIRAKAVLALAEGRLKSALRLATEAVATAGGAVPPSPHDLALAHELVGDVRKRLGRAQEAVASYDEAIRHYEALARGRPNQARALLGRAEALASLGKKSLARESAERALELPDMPAESRTRAANLLASLVRRG
jgi:tetratricopeptide (TPR) repeat protein